MRALVQRVSQAEVEVDRVVTGRIGAGLLVYMGVGRDDTAEDARWLAQKVATLRIFEDEQGKMNRSVQDVRGGILAVSNFTLLGDARYGRRPEFTAAAPPEPAKALYEEFCAALAEAGCTVATGVFRATMAIRSTADGPVNLVIESVRKQGDCAASEWTRA